MKPTTLLLLATTVLLCTACPSKTKTPAVAQKKDSAVVNGFYIDSSELNGDPYKNFSSSADTAAVQSLLDSIQPLLNGPFKEWASTFRNFQLSDFRFANRRPFDSVETISRKDLDSMLQLYQPFLHYSADKTKAIDLYSASLYLEKRGNKYYGTGDVDQTGYFLDIKTMQQQAIFHYGPSAAGELAAWQQPARFVVGGIFVTDDGNRTPILLIGNTDKKEIYYFENNNTNCRQVKDYTAPALRKVIFE